MPTTTLAHAPTSRLRLANLAAAALAVGVATSVALSQTLTTVSVATGLTKPMQVAFAAGDESRLYVIEQRGIVKLIKNGVLQTTAFLNIDSIVPEQTYSGLLGIAFHPQYVANGRFFVYHTTGTTAAITMWLAEYTRSATNADIADATSRRVMFKLATPSTQGYHLGGSPVFGADGLMYLALGDGGYTGDPQGGTRSQSLSYLWGKVLRIDLDSDDFPADADANYHIPAGNPYVGGAAGDDAIFARGLRNPFRCSFDRATGKLWIGDVGGTVREEIDVLNPVTDAGINYGWNCVEGMLCTSNSNCSCPSSTLTAPIYDYTHSVGLCITGGSVYHGCAIPSLVGQYLYGDYQNNKAWRMNFASGSPVVTDITTQLAPVSGIACIGEDARGELYVVNHISGTVRKITSNPAPPDGDGDGIPNSCETRIADVDNNGTVNAADLASLLAAWNAPGATDLNADGRTDAVDMSMMLADWG